MKYRILLLSTLITLSGCAMFNLEFADERFNRPLISHGMHPWDVYLTRVSVIEDNREGDRAIYYDCKILENKKNFIKYKCQGLWFTGYINKLMPKEKIITFEITEWDDFFEGYLVERRDYVWSKNINDWTWGGSGYYVYHDDYEKWREKYYPH